MTATACIKLLLAAGAELEAKDNNLRTPLIIAASEGSAEAVIILLSKRADANAQDDLGHILR